MWLGPWVPPRLLEDHGTVLQPPARAACFLCDFQSGTLTGYRKPALCTAMFTTAKGAGNLCVH